MERKKFVYWKDDDMWLGYLEEFPDYMTQGETLDELKENLRDICSDLNNLDVSCINNYGKIIKC